MAALSRHGERWSPEGQRILITGGSSGIGLACARRLTRAGATVVVLARGEEALAEAREALGPQARAIAADVGDPIAMREAVQRAAEQLGGLDAIVAGAGVGVYGPFTEMTPDDYERSVRTTLASPGSTSLIVSDTGTAATTASAPDAASCSSVRVNSSGPASGRAASCSD